MKVLMVTYCEEHSKGVGISVNCSVAVTRKQQSSISTFFTNKARYVNTGGIAWHPTKLQASPFYMYTFFTHHFLIT